MDVFSHALWGYAVVRWRGPRTARWGALLGAAPDVLYVVMDGVRRVLTRGWAGLESMGQRGNPAIWRRDGPPLPEDLVEAYQNAYVFTHSLVLLAMMALIWWILRRRAPWLLLPWALHILMDIPSHERYLTPFLYPVSSFTIEGIAWSRPPMLLANYGALIAAYALLIWRFRLRPRPGAWPEASSGVA